MTRILELPLEGGGSVLFEVDNVAPEKTYRGAADSAVIVATDTFDSMVGRMKPIVDRLGKQLSDVAHAPDSIAVEFGVKVNANAGVVIAKVGSEASLRVTLTWKRSA